MRIGNSGSHRIASGGRTLPAALGLFAAALALVSVLAYGQQTTIVLDGNSKGRIFDGIGAVSAGASSRLLIDYPEPQRSQILDYLFKPGYGAALQRLKVEIGADVNSTDGSEPSHMRTPADRNATRGYEWWLMEQAHQRNPNIILEVLPWGAPSWVGTDSLYTPKMAAYVAEFIKMAKSEHGLQIAYAGLWNENVFDTAYVKELHRRFEAEGISTRIVCCDEYPGEGAGQWAIADEMLKDPELAGDIYAIGVHYPEVNGKITTTDAARKTGKPLWASEDQPNGGGGPFVTRDWAVGGRRLAHLYNQNYLEGSLTATEIWSPVTSYYDILAAPNSGLMYANTPWSGNYKVQGAIWATAHTTQFAQPGWQYLDDSSGSLRGTGSYVTLRSADKTNWSVVLETIGAANPQSIKFRLAGGLATSTVHIWETNLSRTFEHVTDVTPANADFQYTFDPDSLYSLTTTTGQGKGEAQPPPPAPFPFPYVDNFESTALGCAPRYLADQDGAFEVQPCDGRSGKCLEQVITATPIRWGPLPDPYTMTGDAAWTDYSVAADVGFPSSAPATLPANLMGRIDTADIVQGPSAHFPSGYVLRLYPSGSWQILSSSYKMPIDTLASGKVSVGSLRWHRMELRFQGTSIEAFVDGKKLASLTNDAHAHGMIGMGTGWNRIQFDNLQVEPLQSSTK